MLDMNVKINSRNFNVFPSCDQDLTLCERFLLQCSYTLLKHCTSVFLSVRLKENVFKFSKEDFLINMCLPMWSGTVREFLKSRLKEVQKNMDGYRMFRKT